MEKATIKISNDKFLGPFDVIDQDPIYRFVENDLQKFKNVDKGHHLILGKNDGEEVRNILACSISTLYGYYVIAPKRISEPKKSKNKQFVSLLNYDGTAIELLRMASVVKL